MNRTVTVSGDVCDNAAIKEPVTQIGGQRQVERACGTCGFGDNFDGDSVPNWLRQLSADDNPASTDSDSDRSVMYCDNCPMVETQIKEPRCIGATSYVNVR
jgi:hypothetical protein